MARLHSLMVWSVVFGFLATASLYAAEPKEPKQKRTKAPVEKPQLQRSDDPFSAGAKPAKLSGDPFSAGAKPAKLSAKKPAKPAVKEVWLGGHVAAIEEALAKPTELDFTETPLQDVIDYLKQCHRIEIKIDNRALGDVGIGTDSPVTVNLKGVSLRAALNLMLRELNLTWTIQDEVLAITTPEEEENHLLTRLYDVADLVVCRDDHDQLWDDYDALIDIITATIKPTTWDEVGGPGSVKGSTLGTARVLVVGQTYRTHGEVADLLAKIREIAKKTPNAGTPRRNKPTSPSQHGRGATQGAMGGGMGGMGGNMTQPAANATGASGPAQKGQPPKPDAAKH